MNSSEHGTFCSTRFQRGTVVLIVVLIAFFAIISKLHYEARVYNRTIDDANDLNDMHESGTDTYEWLPMMLVNIGVRSSGTTELAGLIKKYVHPNSGLCGTVSWATGKMEYKCLAELHYWDDIIHCSNSGVINSSNNSYLNSKLSNNSIDFSLNLNYTPYGKYNFEKMTTKYFCNSKNYIDNWFKHHKIILRSRPELENMNTSNLTHFDIIESISSKILYEKSPRYYMYPHISFIFANSLLLKRSKILLFLRDPIKSFLSGYYDAATRESKQLQLQEKNDSLVSKEWLDNLLNQLIFNNMYKMKFVMESLSYYIANNNQFISNTNENSTSWNLNLNLQLIDTYNKIDFFWKKYNYANGIKKNAKYANHEPYIFRNCHIMLLISWFKDFGYLNWNWKNDGVRGSVDHDHDNNSKMNNLRNRFKIIQSEYYFANEEKVFNYLINWTLSGGTKYQQNANQFENISLKPRKARHSNKWRPDISNDSLHKIQHFYFPCTIHMVNFFQTNKYRDQLLYGGFDPNSWQLAMEPLGQPKLDFF